MRIPTVLLAIFAAACGSETASEPAPEPAAPTSSSSSGGGTGAETPGTSSSASTGASSAVSSSAAAGSSSSTTASSSASSSSASVASSSSSSGSTTPSPVCGNGTVERGEECDDGNAATEECAYGNVGCSVCGALCRWVTGHADRCGDGTVNGPETCDDGNASIEECAYGQTACSVCGIACMPSAGTTSYCGDGRVNGPEACDDGNTRTEVCAYGLRSCSVCASTCVPQAGMASYCGDGVVNGPETCDDANSDDTDGCHNNCKEDRDYACEGNPSVCRTSFVDIVNRTSFGFITVVVDGEEWTSCGDTYGLPAGEYASSNPGVLSLAVKPNVPHTLHIENGVAGGNPCQRSVYEQWNLQLPALVADAATSYVVVNGRSLQQAVTGGSGATSQCYWLAYNDGAVTRVAKYRFNLDGTYVFKEYRNVDNVLLRQQTGTYVETSRTLGNDLSFQGRFGTTAFWEARFDAYGSMFIKNTVTTSGSIMPTYAGHGRDPSMCP